MELSTSTNICFERRQGDYIPVQESMRLCASAGYRKLDFGFAELALSSPHFAGPAWREEIGEIKKLAEELGLSFVQAHGTIWDFCNPGQNEEWCKELFCRSIQGAAILGAPWVVVHPSTGCCGGGPDPDTHRKNVAFFQEYAAYAANLGTGLAIENMWGKTRTGIPRYALQAEELLRLVEDVNCRQVRVCWDVEHGSIEGLDQRKALRLLKDYLVATHISDETGPDHIHILPYLGHADWEEILDGLAAIQYDGTFNFEIQHYLPGVPEELLLPALEFSYKVGDGMIRRLEQRKEWYLRARKRW